MKGDRSITSFNRNFYSNEATVKGEAFSKDAIKLLIETCEKHADLREFVPHLARVDDKLIDNLIAEYSAYHIATEPKGIFVLNHGDFHFKNMMVQQNSKGVLKDIMLVSTTIAFPD